MYVCMYVRTYVCMYACMTPLVPAQTAQKSKALLHGGREVTFQGGGGGTKLPSSGPEQGPFLDPTQTLNPKPYIKVGNSQVCGSMK